MLIRQPTDGATGQFTQNLSCRVMWRPLVSMRPLSAEFGTKEDDRLTCRVMWRPLVPVRPLSAEFGTKEDDRGDGSSSSRYLARY